MTSVNADELGPSPSSESSGLQNSTFMNTINDLINKEKNLRLELEKLLQQSRFGKVINQITAIFAGFSTFLYLGITYHPDFPVIMDHWFDNLDRTICTEMLVIYLFNCYVKQHRMVYLVSSESIFYIMVVTPILAIKDLSMTGELYVFVALSRYIRVALFCVIMKQYVDLGETDFDRQTNYIFVTLVLIVTVSSGMFGEIENSQNLEEIHLDNPEQYLFYQGDFEEHKFHNSLYFIIVTLLTVGYGDINPTTVLGQVITIMMIVVTIVIVP